MEFNKKNLDFVVKVLKDNKVSYCSKIEGYFNDEPEKAEVRDMASRFFELLSKHAIDGINNGFNKKIIEEASEQIAAQMNVKAEKHIKDAAKVYERLSTAKYKGNIEKDNYLAGRLYGIISDTIRSAKMFLQYQKDVEGEARDTVLAGIEKLEEALEMVNNVFDYTSKESIALYNDAYECVQKWANEVVGTFITPNTNLPLERLFEDLEQWSNLVLNGKKETELKALDYGTTDLDRFEEVCTGALNDIEGIRTAFEIRKKNYDKREYDLQALNDKINELNNKKEALENEKLEVKRSYKNGDISKDVALNKLDFISGKLEDLDDEIYTYNAELKEEEEMIAASRQERLQYESMFRKIDKMKDSPINFYYVVNERNIQIDKIKDLFSGKARSNEEISEAVFQVNQLESGYNDAHNITVAAIEKMKNKRFVSEAHKTERKKRSLIEDDRRKELEDFLDGDTEDRNNSKNDIDDLDIDEKVSVRSNKE